MSALHISISAEKLFSLGPIPFTNSMLNSVIASGLIVAFAVAVRLSLKKTNKPTGVQNFAEILIDGFSSFINGITLDAKRTTDFLPLILSFFLFILMNNWLGLLPGNGTIGFYESAAEEHAAVRTLELPQVGHVYASTPVEEPHQATPTTPTESTQSHEGTQTVAPTEAAHEPAKIFVPLFRAGTADLNTTLALGALSVFFIQFFGVKYLGMHYFGKFLNFSSPIHFFVGILEIVSEFSRIISFAFRLFGNVFAGEVLLVVMSALAKVVVPMPFYGMEIFVGLIQAVVFSMLSVVLINMATLGHGEKH